MTWRLIKLLGFLLVWHGFSPLLAQNCDCKTTGNCPVMIQDYGTYRGTLNVTVNGPNDLGLCPLTKVCFSISHTWIGDLSVSLTSPNGTNYLIMADANNNFGGCGNNSDNVEVCIVLGKHRPLMNNQEYGCNSAPCESGTCCITGDWTVPCGGVTDSVAFAKQAPNCDLNDFNQPGAPANGIWTLTVNDMCVEDFGSLNNFSLYFGCGTVICSVCKSDGGSIPVTSVSACQGDSKLNLSLPPQYPSGKPAPNPAEYDYSYVIVKADTIVSILPKADLTTLSPGTYRVYGFSHAKAAASQLSSLKGWKLDSARMNLQSTVALFCGSFSKNFAPVNISAASQITFIDTTVCEGTCVMVGGVNFCDSGKLTLTSSSGCDSIVMVNISKTPSILRKVSMAVCTDSCVVIAGKSYCLPGPHTIILKTSNGCDSIITLELTERKVLAAISPVSPPALSCINTSVELNASGSTPANVSYLWSGPGGFLQTTQKISATTPGRYNLLVKDASAGLTCSSSAFVDISGDVSRPNIFISNSNPEICFGDSLSFGTLGIEDLNKTSPVFSIHSGTPATSANEITGARIAPDKTTIYYVLATGTLCSDEKSFIVKVNQPPSADFSVQSATCQDSTASVIYTGNAGITAAYNWNFDGGSAQPSSGKGPYKVLWSGTPGTKTVSLEVSEKGCLSQKVSYQIAVQPSVPVPTIQCTQKQDAVEFTWLPTDSVSYKVVVISGPSGILTGPNKYVVSGLLPSTPVVIEMTATGKGMCPPVIVQSTCSSLDCSGLVVNLNEPGVLCLNSISGKTTLKSEVIGNSGSGKGAWSGPGITDSLKGIFETAFSGPGKHNIVYTYTDGNCSVRKNLAVQVALPPVADAGKPAVLSCWEDEKFAVLGGNSSTGFQYKYLWQKAGGTFPGDSTVLNPKVYLPGLYTLTITDTLTGCTANSSVDISATQEKPQASISMKEISCIGMSNGLINVDAVKGGISPYLFSINDSPFSTSPKFDGLGPGKYTIEVMDFAGCKSSSTIILEEGKQLRVEILTPFGKRHEIKLGDSLLLELLVNIPQELLNRIRWEPASLTSCDSCLSTFVYPKETTNFKITAQSGDCRDDDVVTVYVDKNYLLYAPTAFSPNGNGINDRFTLFGGPQVQLIQRFAIFDRWGEMVFHKENILPNDTQNGWDGKWKGQKLPPGVFNWFAVVDFIDGRQEVFDGTVTLVK